MKTTKRILQTSIIALMACGCVLPSSMIAADTSAKQISSIGIVNFKSCVEQSKIGKQEQALFDAMKKQMETILAEKDKELAAMSEKFKNPDFIDSLSPEAEEKLKNDLQAQSQEFGQLQTQYYQTLQQANYKILQKLAEVVGQAASDVAKELNLDLVVNEDSVFYFKSAFDISPIVVAKMDAAFEKDINAKK